ncbi:hypothetical protein TNCT_342341 [Trichonephila clavata]|uniref:Uncharacterized protein n=1 Tax=Trichonephila clavata TaxID=2740835 RepID=A0A8X6HQL2_TRICU|nr:hypothetical protein TNCT_342341 [Trichonephila clavata]
MNSITHASRTRIILQCNGRNGCQSPVRSRIHHSGPNKTLEWYHVLSFLLRTLSQVIDWEERNKSSKGSFVFSSPEICVPMISWVELMGDIGNDV